MFGILKKPKKSIRLSVYIHLCIIYGAFTAAFFYLHLLRCADGKRPDLIAFIILMVCVLLMDVVVGIVRAHKKKTHFDPAANIFAAIPIYMSIMFLFVFKNSYVFLGYIWGMVSVVFLMVLFSLIEVKGSILRRIRYSFALAGLVFVVIIGPRIGKIHRRSLYTKDDYSMESYYDDRYDILNHLETIAKAYDEEVWRSLTVDERFEVLKTAVYCEFHELGIGHKANVVKGLGDNENGKTLGAWSESDNTLYISDYQLEHGKGADCMKTVYHECYHAYTYQICDLYIRLSPKERALVTASLPWYADIENIMKSYNHAENTELEFEEYFLQASEIASRNYADKQVIFYKGFVFTKLNED